MYDKPSGTYICVYKRSNEKIQHGNEQYSEKN